MALVHRRKKIILVVVFLAMCYTCVGLVLWYSTPSSMASSAGRLDNSVQLPVRLQQPSFTPVVIVAYMRTGSSLTGNVIQQDPDVFYVFEPLHDLIRQYQDEMAALFPDLKLQAGRPLMLMKEKVEMLYRAWMTCDMEYIISEPNRYHIGFLKLGIKTNLLLKCLDNASDPVFQYNQMPCTDMLRDLCLKSKFRLFKTIRTPMSWLKDLMVEFPNMKIVHLVRDPRAVVVSQRRFGECSREKHNGVAGCSKLLCSSMEDDLTTAEVFSTVYPGRIFSLKYEDLAIEPIEKTKELYEFLDLNFTDEIRKYIVNITMSGNNASFVLDTIRPDSKHMIDRWRTSITPRSLDIVQTMCKYVMKTLSYHHFIKPV